MTTTPALPLDLARITETLRIATAETADADLPHGIAAVVDDANALLAEVRRLRAELAELKRPAVEAKRNEIRSSYAETIAQARDDRDYEGAFALECQLREREEQWRDEDRAAAS